MSVSRFLSPVFFLLWAEPQNSFQCTTARQGQRRDKAPYPDASFRERLARAGDYVLPSGSVESEMSDVPYVRRS